jgi:hypothetical protein
VRGVEAGEDLLDEPDDVVAGQVRLDEVGDVELRLDYLCAAYQDMRSK